MHNKEYIFIQARMGSQRFPGKVLRSIGGKVQLQHLLDRLGRFTQARRVVVVTTENAEDNQISDFCAAKGIICYRGSDWDVLSRFVNAAEELKLSDDSIIVRLTADCPLHHEEVVSFALNEFHQHHLDYFSNSFPPHFEDGCDTEVFKLKILREASKHSNLLSQREHVTPFIKDSGLYLCGYKKFNTDYKFKLSVDTIHDHAAVNRIFSRLSPDTLFPINQIVSLLKAEPEILQINQESIINEGYAISLKNDKQID